jgi:hypothetical protein
MARKRRNTKSNSRPPSGITRPFMGVSSDILRASTSLWLGERVIVRCVDGALGAEYALFEPGEIVLRATDPVTVRETGYLTTAGQAMAHLNRAGITVEFAKKAANAIAPEVIASYARGLAIRSLASRLGPQELFDGGIFGAASQTYQGTWLRLQSMAAALGGGAAFTMQALHLAMTLSEVADDTTLQLATTNITRSSRSGERTYRRTTFESPHDLPARLRALQPNPSPAEIDRQADAELREALVARVRERATVQATAALREHLGELEDALAGTVRQAAPIDGPELRAIEQQLGTGDAGGVDERLDLLELRHGPLRAIRYLRARAAFVRGDEPPRAIAQTLSAIADEAAGLHAAGLAAARAWLAAGEETHARYFAHRLADDSSAPESARLVALEILEETTLTTRSNAPPPASTKPLPVTHAQQEIGDNAVQVGPALDAAPPGASLPPVGPPIASAIAAEGVAGLPMGSPQSNPPVRYDAELVEALTLPSETSEEELGYGETPVTPSQARVAMTRLARTLGRDYRLWYGMTLRCNLLALDIVQRHLAQRYVGTSLADAKTTSELLRHGALLSEIIARSLGGAWVDVRPTECGYWAMLLPNATRCWPIGRVYRFATLGPRDRDLVAYYVDLEKRARGRQA